MEIMNNNYSNSPSKLINNQTYKYYVRLYNDDGYSQILNPAMIFQLVIEDDILFWPERGFLIYENTEEIFERKFASSEGIETLDAENAARVSLKDKEPYVFRNDGRDYLDIIILPETMLTTDLPIKNLKKEIWELANRYVVYDKEDIESPDNVNKIKKLYFWDREYQKMLETKTQWSTATSALNKSNTGSYDAAQASDDEREMPTGDAIKDILKTNGFEIDEGNFDSGAVKIFHSCYNDQNIWDNINYLLKYHVAKPQEGTSLNNVCDICVFKKDRHNHKFELVPISQIFKKAGAQADNPLEYQIEHLFFEERGSPVYTNRLKAPLLNELDTTKDVMTTKIRNYQFVDMADSDSTHNLVTHQVHSYDFKNKTFIMNTTHGQVDKVEENIGKLYIDKKLLTYNGIHPLITLNKTKTENKSIKPVYSILPSMASIQSHGSAKLLYTGIFLNQCIKLKLDGSTIRRSGRFLGIDRETLTDNTFDYKLCGQWFTTNIKHVFYHDKYFNEILAVKVHSADDLKRSKTVD